MTDSEKVPFPELQIVPIKNILPHEVHDSQRASPLLERIRQAETLTNPPVIAPVDDENYVILDGANRYHTFAKLGYRDLLVQVASYDSGFVELEVWQHIISDWERVYFITDLQKIAEIELVQGWQRDALAQVMLREGAVISLQAQVETLHERNHILRQVVDVYQKNATLNRTALNEPAQIWRLYPDALALMLFPAYHPSDIIAAARDDAPLPPGISRHIIHGRALELHYPLAALKNDTLSLEEKNEALQQWLKNKLAKRSVRYYAESTYQFDE